MKLTKQSRRRFLAIHISNHAFERWIEYGGKPHKNKLKGLVRGILTAHLRMGLPIDHTGAAQLPVPLRIKKEEDAGKLFAAVVPGEMGWVVVTFHKGEKGEKASGGGEELGDENFGEDGESDAATGRRA